MNDDVVIKKGIIDANILKRQRGIFSSYERDLYSEPAPTRRLATGDDEHLRFTIRNQ